MDYVDRLKELRTDKQLDQNDIADLLYCQQSTVSRYECRRIRYEVEDIIKLCEFYGVSADYILGLPKGLKYPER